MQEKLIKKISLIQRIKNGIADMSDEEKLNNEYDHDINFFHMLSALASILILDIGSSIFGIEAFIGKGETVGIIIILFLIIDFTICLPINYFIEKKHQKKFKKAGLNF